MLAEIAGADVGAEQQGCRCSARSGRLMILKQGRFAGPVDPDHGDLLLPPDRAGEAAEHLFLLVRPAVCQTLPRSSRCRTSSPLRGGTGKSKRDGPLLGRQFDPFDLVDLLDPRLDLGGMGGPGGEAGDELLFLGQHLLLPAVAGQQLFAADLPLLQVEIVVAAVGGDRCGWPPR